MPDNAPALNSGANAYDLESRVALLEKNFRTHLGPNLGASSLNIPHPQLASLDSRVTALETALTALTVIVTANTAAIRTAGRYL